MMNMLVWIRLMRVLPFLTYANKDNMALVINHFTEVLDFNRLA